MAYIERDLLEKRLTKVGYKYLTDAEQTGTVQSDEEEDVIDTAIAFASNRIDAAICGQVDPTHAQAQQNAFLQDLCLDIAVYRAMGTGGKAVPETFVNDYLAALKQLDSLKSNRVRIPNFSYPSTVCAPKISRTPKSFNPRS